VDVAGPPPGVGVPGSLNKPPSKPPGVGEIGEGTRPGIKTPVSRGHPGGGQPPIFNATYVVKKGQTLDSVAKQFKISRVELAHANGLGTGAGLRTGQKLKVPSPAGTGTPNKAA
jgi:LysM repeat protein